MKKTASSNLIKIVAISLLLILTTVFSSRVEATENDETYTIGIDTAFAPYAYMDEEGEYAGIVIDIFKAVAEDQNIDYEFHNMSFSAALQALESNQVDGIAAGTTITPAREKAFDFSDPYYVGGNKFAVKTDSELQSLEDLEGEIVAVKSGTTGFDVGEELQDEYGYELMVYEDSPSMYESVMSGSAKAAIEVTAVMQYAINSGQVNIRQIGEDIKPSEMGFAVNKGHNKELLNKFNAGLANIRADGTYDDIVNTYMGEEAVQEQQQGDNIFTQLKNNAVPLLEGLWVTIWVSLISILIAIIIGVFAGLMRVSSSKILNGLVTFYIDLMRGIPMIVFIFFIYFGVAKWFNVSFTPEVAGIVALSVNSGAFVAEIVRGGIEAVPHGQTEAASSLGLSKSTTMRKIILPQAIKVMAPSFINQFVMTLKNSSILSVIGMVELTQTGRIIISRTYQSGNIWLIVGLMYYIGITFLTKLSNYLSKRAYRH